MLQVFFLIILITSTFKCFGEDESIDTKQPQSIENTEDEPMYNNHKYYDDELMGSIQKCNVPYYL